MAALREQRPDVLEVLEDQRDAKRQKLEQQHKLSSLFKGAVGDAGRQAPGSSSAASAAPADGGFTFGFSFGRS